MKKIYSALLAMTIAFGLSTTAFADVNNPVDDWGVIAIPAVGQTVKRVTDGVADGSLDAAAGFIEADYLFSVNLVSSLGSTVTSFSFEGLGFESFGTKLLMKVVPDDGPINWVTVATGMVTEVSDNSWLSKLNYSPLSATPTVYSFQVFGEKVEGEAAYGGNVAFKMATPVPEPEIYAMLVAGLGLMGFVARRRQRNGTVS